MMEDRFTLSGQRCAWCGLVPVVLWTLPLDPLVPVVPTGYARTASHAGTAAAAAATIHQKYAPRNRPAGRRRTEPGASSDAQPIPALHAHDMFTWVMQRMGLERVVRIGGIDLAQVPPLAEPALDDVHVVHPTCPPFCDE